ncbi:unnamed protein product, partial [Amoebophrya sp. A25]|eukprot:GSA25T00011591001.1
MRKKISKMPAKSKNIGRSALFVCAAIVGSRGASIFSDGVVVHKHNIGSPTSDKSPEEEGAHITPAAEDMKENSSEKAENAPEVEADAVTSKGLLLRLDTPDNYQDATPSTSASSSTLVAAPSTSVSSFSSKKRGSLLSGGSSCSPPTRGGTRFRHRPTSSDVEAAAVDASASSVPSEQDTDETDDALAKEVEQLTLKDTEVELRREIERERLE